MVSDYHNFVDYFLCSLINREIEIGTVKVCIQGYSFDFRVSTSPGCQVFFPLLKLAFVDSNGCLHEYNCDCADL